MNFNGKSKTMLLKQYDERRQIIVPGNQEATVNYCVDDFIDIAIQAIKERNLFCAALSGGSTPHAIFEHLAKKENAKKINWEKVRLFWSDERNAPPDDPESNYKMALDSGLNQLPIPPTNIFRMQAEANLEENALAYENLINQYVPNQTFDLIMLGMGDDGHTASLFPHTQGLDVQNRLVIANYIPQKQTWRMTFTFAQIHQSRNIRIYVIGEKKAEMLRQVLSLPYHPHDLPSQAVGTASSKALWIADLAAAQLLV